MSARRAPVAVIDPGMRTPELECLGQIAIWAEKAPVSYHLPALFGFSSLNALGQTEPSAIIILGSAASIYDDNPWSKPLTDWLRPRLNAGIPTLGICFGHQFLAGIYDGTVGYVQEDQTKHKGLRRVDFSADPLWGQAMQGEVVISHREMVTHCPPEFRVIGTSPLVPIEAMAHKQLPIWGVQFHPEASPSFLANQGIELHNPSQDLAFGHSLVKAFLRRAQLR